MKVVIIFVGLLAIVNCSIHGHYYDDDSDDYRIPNGQPDCSEIINWGRRFRHTWYPQRFWYCDGGDVELVTCPDPQLFQASISKCVSPWKWQCELENYPTKPTESTDPSESTEPIDTTEPTNTTEPTEPTKQTDPTETTTPTEPIEPPQNPSCDAARCDDFWHFILQPTHDPHSMWACMNGRPVLLRCPNNEFFNYFGQNCVDGENWASVCDEEYYTSD